MLIRTFHNRVIISAREEQPREGSDGWDHVLITKSGRAVGPLLTFAEAVRTAKELEQKAQGEQLATAEPDEPITGEPEPAPESPVAAIE